jgi:hypothetical protein
MDNHAKDIKDQKPTLEERRLALEQSKAIWTAVSVVVPLLAAVATGFYGIWKRAVRERHIVVPLAAPSPALQTGRRDDPCALLAIDLGRDRTDGVAGPCGRQDRELQGSRAEVISPGAARP